MKRRQALTRTGARPGDELYVSGPIGAAAAGLQMLQAAAQAARPRRTAGWTALPATGDLALSFVPSRACGSACCSRRNRAASACIDLSDGLADAVHRIAEASGVGAIIDADAVPIDTDARAHGSRRADSTP